MVLARSGRALILCRSRTQDCALEISSRPRAAYQLRRSRFPVSKHFTQPAIRARVRLNQGRRAVKLTWLRAAPNSMVQAEPRSMGHLSTAHTPACTPAQTPACVPACTPSCEPEHAPERVYYAVHDAAGVVIGVSEVDEDPETPATHAAWVLWWALDSGGIRGRWTLASVLERAYRTSARRDGLSPMPWKTVATALREFVPVA